MTYIRNDRLLLSHLSKLCNFGTDSIFPKILGKRTKHQKNTIFQLHICFAWPARSQRAYKEPTAELYKKDFDYVDYGWCGGPYRQQQQGLSTLP